MNRKFTLFTIVILIISLLLSNCGGREKTATTTTKSKNICAYAANGNSESGNVSQYEIGSDGSLAPMTMPSVPVQ